MWLSRTANMRGSRRVQENPVCSRWELSDDVVELLSDDGEPSGRSATAKLATGPATEDR